MDKLLQAIHFATQQHLGQKRKDRKTPYISHPLAVGLILSKVTADVDVIIAGILHDVIEDTKTTEKEIQSWKDRKQEVLDNIEYLSQNSALVESADNLHNMYDMRVNVQNLGLSYFDNFSASATDKLAYERKKLEKFKKYHKDNPFLKELEKHLKFLELQLK